MNEYKESDKTSFENSYIKVGIILIVFGILFACEDLFKIDLLYKFWPLIITILGIGFIKIFLRREKREVLFVGIGTYLICFSLLSLYLNFTEWSQMNFLWPLFITFIGVVFIVIYFFRTNHKMYLFVALVMLSISIVFFLIFSFNLHLWWIVFILIGISILIVGRLK